MIRVSRVSGMRLQVQTPSGTFYIDRTDDGVEELRPTDLLMGSLGGCMAGTLLTLAKLQNWEVGPVNVELEPVIAHRPERVESVAIKVRFSADLDQATADHLMRAAKHCKIHNTLKSVPQIEVDVAFDAEPGLDTGQRWWD